MMSLITTISSPTPSLLASLVLVFLFVGGNCCAAEGASFVQSSEPLLGWSARSRVTKSVMPRPYTAPWSSVKSADATTTITERQSAEYGYTPTALNGLAISSHVATSTSSTTGKNAEGVSVLPLTTTVAGYVPSSSTSATDWESLSSVSLGLFPAIDDILAFSHLRSIDANISVADIIELLPNLTASSSSSPSTVEDRLVIQRMANLWRRQRSASMCLNTADASLGGSTRLRATNLDFCDNVGGVPSTVLSSKSSVWGEGTSAGAAPRPFVSSASATALCRYVFWESEESGFGGPGAGGGAFGIAVRSSGRREFATMGEETDVFGVAGSDSLSAEEDSARAPFLDTLRRTMSEASVRERRINYTSSLFSQLLAGNPNSSTSSRAVYRRTLQTVSDVAGFAATGIRQPLQNGFLVSSGCNIKTNITVSLSAPDGVVFPTGTGSASPSTNMTGISAEVAPPSYLYIRIAFKVLFDCSCNGGAATVPVQVRGTIYQRRVFRNDSTAPATGSGNSSSYTPGYYVVDATALGPQSNLSSPASSGTSTTTPPASVFTSSNMVAVWNNIDAFNSVVHGEECLDPGAHPVYNISRWHDACRNKGDPSANAGGFESSRRGAYCGARTGLGIAAQVDLGGRLWEDASSTASRAAMALGTVVVGSVDDAVAIAATSASRVQIAALGVVANETACGSSATQMVGSIPGTSLAAAALSQTSTPVASPLDSSYVPDPTLPYEDAMWSAMSAIQSSFAYALTPAGYAEAFSNATNLRDENHYATAGEYVGFAGTISTSQLQDWHVRQRTRYNLRSLWGSSRPKTLTAPSTPSAPTNNTMIAMQRLFRLQLTQAAMSLTCRGLSVPFAAAPILGTARSSPFPDANGPESSDAAMVYPYRGVVPTPTTIVSPVSSTQAVDGSTSASDLMSTLFPPEAVSAWYFNASYISASGTTNPFAYRYFEDCTPSSVTCVDITQQGAQLAPDPVMTTAHRQYRLMSPYSLPVTDGSTTTTAGQRESLLSWLGIRGDVNGSASPFTVANSAFTLANPPLGGSGGEETDITVLDSSSDVSTDYIDFDHHTATESIIAKFTSSSGRFTGKFRVEGLRNVTVFVPYRANVSRQVTLTATQSSDSAYLSQIAFLNASYPSCSSAITSLSSTLRAVFNIVVEVQRYEAVTIHQRVFHIGCSHCEGGEQSEKVAVPHIPVALLQEPVVATPGGDGNVIRVVSVSRDCSAEATTTTTTVATSATAGASNASFIRVYLDPDTRGNGFSTVTNILMTHASQAWHNAGLQPRGSEFELRGLFNVVPFYSLGTTSLMVRSSKAPIAYRRSNPAVPASLNLLCDSLFIQNEKTVSGVVPTTKYSVFRSDAVALQDAASYLPPSRVTSSSVLSPSWVGATVSLQTAVVSPRTVTCDKAGTCSGNGCCERWEPNRKATLFKSSLATPTSTYPTVDYGAYIDALSIQWYVLNPASVCIDPESDRVVGNFYVYAYETYWGQLYGGTYYDPSSLGSSAWAFFSPNIAVKDNSISPCVCFDLSSVEGAYAGSACSACDVSYGTTSADGNTKGLQGQPTAVFAADPSSYLKCTVEQPQVVVFLTDLSTRPLAMTAPTLLVVFIFLLIGYARRSWISDLPLATAALRRLGLNPVGPCIVEDDHVVGGPGEAVSVYKSGCAFAGSNCPQPVMADAESQWRAARDVAAIEGEGAGLLDTPPGGGGHRHHPTAAEMRLWSRRGPERGRTVLGGGVPPRAVEAGRTPHETSQLAFNHPYNRLKRDLLNQFLLDNQPPQQQQQPGEEEPRTGATLRRLPRTSSFSRRGHAKRPAPVQEL